MIFNKAKFRELRERRGLTLKQVASACGVAEATVQKWEKRADFTPRPSKLIAICKVLGCDKSELAIFGESTIKNNPKTEEKAMKDRIEVYNRDDAWKKAQELFPGDYDEDSFASSNAGYPIYRQNGGPSWISDLGARLELTIVDAKGNCETINIWIEDRKYTAAEVREIVTAQRKELEAINAIRLAAEAMETHTGEAVIELLDRLEYSVAAKLEQFGI